MSSEIDLEKSQARNDEILKYRWGGLGCHNKIWQARWLKQQTFISLKIWRLKVHNHGASKFGLWWEHSSWLAHGYHLTVRSHGLSCTGVWGGGWDRREREKALFLMSLLIRTLILSEQRPLWPHLTLSSLETPSPNTTTQGLGYQHMKGWGWGGKHSVHTSNWDFWFGIWVQARKENVNISMRAEPIHVDEITEEYCRKDSTEGF